MSTKQIDVKLQATQEEIDRIADSMYDKSSTFADRLKVQTWNIGMIRADIERISQEIKEQNDNNQHSQLAIALMKRLVDVVMWKPPWVLQKYVGKIAEEWCHATDKRG